MENIFLKLLNMSITASWMILAVMLLRLVFKRAPKAIWGIMWGLVGIRLILPFSFESVLSLVPSSETVPQDIIYSSSPEIHSGIFFLNSTVNPIISDSLAPTPSESVNPMQIITLTASYIWLAGIAVLVIYSIISYLRIYAKVREAAILKENIWICDRISTPFIFGIIRPRIYLPSDMSGQDTEYVIAHEKAHLKRRDHWWKPIGFAFLTVYWFNPIIWTAYILLCRDIELACDERVIKELGYESKKPYSDALINCSMPRRMIAACPLAFGEVNVKGRIKNVLSYKKPAFWIIIAAIIACIALTIGFLTDPAEDTSSPESSQPQESSEVPETPDLSLTEHRLPDRMDADFVDVLNYFVAKADRILHSGEVITIHLIFDTFGRRMSLDELITFNDDNKVYIDTSLLDKSDLQAYTYMGDSTLPGESSTDYDDIRYFLTLQMLYAYYEGCFYRVNTSGVYSEIYELAPKYSPGEYESPEACYGAAWSELFEENGEQKYNAIIVFPYAKSISTPNTSTHKGEDLYPKAVELSIKALQESSK